MSCGPIVAKGKAKLLSCLLSIGVNEPLFPHLVICANTIFSKEVQGIQYSLLGNVMPVKLRVIISFL